MEQGWALGFLFPGPTPVGCGHGSSGPVEQRCAKNSGYTGPLADLMHATLDFS